MNTEQKSLKLAELMGWSVKQHKIRTILGKDRVDFSLDFDVNDEPFDSDMWMQPYANSKDGLAQFAAILLRFIEVMGTIDSTQLPAISPLWDRKPTQANILDEILRMNGVNPDE